MTPAKDTHAKRLFLIDGSALAYRSHFAFVRNPLLSSKGQNVGAIFGFVSSLLRLIDEEKPENIAVAFDASGPTFRHERFPEYKATRQKMPDELGEQLPVIADVVRALNEEFDVSQAISLARMFQREERWRTDKNLRRLELTLGELSDSDSPKAVI